MNLVQKTLFAGLVVFGGMGFGASSALAQGSGAVAPPVVQRVPRVPVPNEHAYYYGPLYTVPPGGVTPYAPRVWRGSLPPSTGHRTPRDWSTGRDSFLAKPWMNPGR
jgi:hypothetical protein